MSDYCVFCDTRRPKGGTNHLILNEGKLWLEFCQACGDKEWLENSLTGERYTVYNLFAEHRQDMPYREPTRTFEDWQGTPVHPDKPQPERRSNPTFADVWPSK